MDMFKAGMYLNPSLQIRDAILTPIPS